MLRRPETSATKKVQLRQLHPLGDSGGIQTHDLQNFFSTKSFCSKNKISTHKTKKVQLRQLHPLVIPVGFKPTTFRTGI